MSTTHHNGHSGNANHHRSGDDRRSSPEEEGATPRPTRNQRGQFAGGSHNPKGRPKKLPPPTSMGEAAARALMEPVSVTIQGKVIKMPKYQALAHKMVANLINANPADMSRLFRMLEKANAFDELKHQEAMQADEQNGNVWTAELEAQFQVLEAEFACQPDDVGTMPSGNVPSGNGDGDLAPGSFQAR